MPEYFEPPEETRWGDQRNIDLPIPAAGAPALIRSLPPLQVIDVRWQTQVWAIHLGLEWQNQVDGIAGEQLDAVFLIRTGVGSALVNVIRVVSVLVAAPISVADLVVANVPAEKIVIACFLQSTAAAGAARTYRGVASMLVAPYTRTSEY